MNTTFLTWIAVAAAVGGALLLFLGMPAAEQKVPLELETVSAEAAVVDEAAYWEPVAVRTSVSQVVAYPVAVGSRTMQPCGACGMASATTIAQSGAYQAHVPPCSTCGAIQPSYRLQGQPCGSCGAAYMPVPEQRCSSCGAAHATATAAVHSCGSCGSTASASSIPLYMQYPQSASCEQRVTSPCGSMPCSSLPMTCVATCGNTCPLDKPGINRNMALCVEECTFVQLHTTIPHPICSDVRFEWTTSKGSFLESNVSDPIYYVPTTQFADGEDVWVVVKITDSRGAQYTDQVKLHVTNRR